MNLYVNKVTYFFLFEDTSQTGHNTRFLKYLADLYRDALGRARTLLSVWVPVLLIP